MEDVEGHGEIPSLGTKLDEHRATDRADVNALPAGKQWRAEQGMGAYYHHPLNARIMYAEPWVGDTSAAAIGKVLRRVIRATSHLPVELVKVLECHIKPPGLVQCTDGSPIRVFIG